jgi:hypothetical protein
VDFAPFDLNAFFGLLLGAGGLASAKAARDVIRYFRMGRVMKEQTLVTSLSSALERSDNENVELKAEHAKEVASLKSDLAHATDKMNYYRNEMGKREYLLEKAGIPYEAAKETFKRRSEPRE